MISLSAMPLSRRDFFRKLVKPNERSGEERLARYELMDQYVRNELLPYDFSLNAEQEAELFAAVRSELEATNDEELFSSILRFKVDEVVDRKVRPWREASHLNEEFQRLKEVRSSAAGYVGAFLNGQATPAALDRLKERFEISDPAILEIELRRRIDEWILTVEDRELLQYDVVTVRDLVFTQLRSWC
jgi:hypothetical protein